MSGRCEECGACTIWDPDVGSAICVECGTLADPTQSVLSSHLDVVDTSGREFAPWSNVPGGSTIRGRNGWALGGQDKESRDRRNTLTMHEFIRTSASRLSNPGVTSRAQALFDQAMRVGCFRWGRKAKLTAGAALAIALRESRKSDSIRDIAYLFNEPPAAISRAFGKVVKLLKLELSAVDPSAHLPALQTHFVSLVSEPEGGAADSPPGALPAALVKLLSQLVPNLPTIVHTATALAWLIARTQNFSHLPTPPTACALFILAIEGERGSSLPNSGTLAQALGARFSVGKGVVMQRYKQIYDLVEVWIRDIPWLDAHERKTSKGGRGEGRSKVAKRVVVARGLKDVVQFQEEIWRKRMENEGRLLLELDVDEKGDDPNEAEWESSQASTSAGTSSASTASTSTACPSLHKKSKTRRSKPVVAASHFLLNPLSASSSPAPSNARRRPTPASSDLLAHLLTTDAGALPHAFAHPPTRLQLLASARGGADAAHIADDELFAEDELAALFRTPEEVEIVRVAMGWEADDAPVSGGSGVGEMRGEGYALSAPASTKKRKRGAGEDDAGPSMARGSKRINMDALARLLDPNVDLDAVGSTTPSQSGSCAPSRGQEAESPADWAEDEEDDVEDETGNIYGEENENDGATPLRPGPSSALTADAEEVVEEWRPMSPGGGGGGCAAEDWYDF